MQIIVVIVLELITEVRASRVINIHEDSFCTSRVHIAHIYGFARC